MDTVTGGTQQILCDGTVSVRALAVLLDGKKMVSASEDDGVILWDTETGEILPKFECNVNKMAAMAFS